MLWLNSQLVLRVCCWWPGAIGCGFTFHTRISWMLAGPMQRATPWRSTNPRNRYFERQHVRIEDSAIAAGRIFLRVITMTSYWAWRRLKSRASRLFTKSFIQTQIKENIKAPRHWPLCGKFTSHPHKRASYAENSFIWWRDHDEKHYLPRGGGVHYVCD